IGAIQRRLDYSIQAPGPLPGGAQLPADCDARVHRREDGEWAGPREAAQLARAAHARLDRRAQSDLWGPLSAAWSKRRQFMKEWFGEHGGLGAGLRFRI
ncbi:hypothetical protein E2562_013357, partial [Oryza meyeriana var. granulata]